MSTLLGNCCAAVATCGDFLDPCCCGCGLCNCCGVPRQISDSYKRSAAERAAAPRPQAMARAPQPSIFYEPVQPQQAAPPPQAPPPPSYRPQAYAPVAPPPQPQAYPQYAPQPPPRAYQPARAAPQPPQQAPQAYQPARAAPQPPQRAPPAQAYGYYAAPRPQPQAYPR